MMRVSGLRKLLSPGLTVESNSAPFANTSSPTQSLRLVTYGK